MCDRSEFPQACFHFLRFHSIWPKNGENISIRFILKILLFFSLPGLQGLLSFSHLFVTLYYKRKAAITDDIVIAFEGSFFLYTLIVYLININTVIGYIDELQRFDRFGRPENLTTFTKTHNRTMKILYYYCFLSVIICAICEVLFIPYCERKNARFGTEDLCGYLLNYWLPFDLDHYYGAHLIMRVFQVVATMILILPAVTDTYLGVTLIDSLALRLEEVRKAFQTVGKLPNLQLKKQQIKHAIKYHIDTIELIDGFNGNLGMFSTVHFGLSSVIIGILNYQVLQDFQIKGVFHLLGWFSTLALLCNAGQNLINKSQQISEELYELDWYNMDYELKSMIKFLIFRSQNQLSINSGIFYSYSHELLETIIEASYSYMTILTQINTRQQQK